MPDLADGWLSGPRAALPHLQRLARLDDAALALEKGPDADRERALREREAACSHRPRRIGKSQVVVCTLCGAQRLPPVDASRARSPMMPSNPAPVTHERAFPAEAMRDLLGIARALRWAAAERHAGAAELARFDDVVRALDRAWRHGVEVRPGSDAEAAAIVAADAAALRVSDLVRLYDEAGAVIGAAMRRVRA